MKTADLMALLAVDSLPVARHATRHRLSLALLVGVALALAMVLIGYGPRSDLLQAVAWPMFWVKLAVPITVAMGGFASLQRLARPGVPLGARWVGLALPVVIVWTLALISYQGAPEDARAALVWGTTWRSCSASITLTSLPVFIAAFIALKSLAPTRPALTGACAGAMASGAGAAAYALHCPELSAPFLAIWYVAGMALPMAIGALLGPRLLRW